MKNTILKQISQEQYAKLKEKFTKGKNREVSRQKLFKAFMAEMDDVSRKRLQEVEGIIFKYTNYFSANGGWIFTSREITNHSSQRLENGYMTYHLLADENGYHMQPEPAPELKVGASRDTEERLLVEHGKELSILHQAYLIRNDIIYNRRYTLKDPSREAFVEDLRELLGYNNPVYVMVPSEPKTEITLK